MTFKLHKRKNLTTRINHPRTFQVGVSGIVNKPFELSIRLQVCMVLVQLTTLKSGNSFECKTCFQGSSLSSNPMKPRGFGYKFSSIISICTNVYYPFFISIAFTFILFIFPSFDRVSVIAFYQLANTIVAWLSNT